MRKSIKYCSYLLIAVFLLFFSVSAKAQYKSQEFNSGDSRVPVLMACGVIGEKTGKAPDSGELAIKFFEFANTADPGFVTPEKLQVWTEDLLVYITDLMESSVNLEIYWDNQCEEQFKKMREVFN